MNTNDLTLEEMKKGFTYDAQSCTYECLICHEKFEEGQVYPIKKRFYEASRAVQIHLQAHKSLLHTYLDYDKKKTGLTEKQNTLIKDISAGMSDKEMAAKNNVATATIRHQRFVLRERAKQAKLYLAIYDLAMLQNDNDDLIKPHSGATMVDERYVSTVSEQEKVLSTYFEDGDRLQLKSLPAKEKRKIMILRRITEELDENRIYVEKELNKILKDIFHDISTIRRYLIEYGFVERTKDCSQYWVKK